MGSVQVGEAFQILAVTLPDIVSPRKNLVEEKTVARCNISIVAPQAGPERSWLYYSWPKHQHLHLRAPLSIQGDYYRLRHVERSTRIYL